MNLTIIGVEQMPEVLPGTDVADHILKALRANDLTLRDRDIVVVTHKIVSKAEGATRSAPDDRARKQIVESESVEIVRRRGDLVIAITAHGFICANAGVDRSNVEPGSVVLLPRDPDASAHRIRTRLERATNTELGVVITDTFGRAWRRGLTDVAIGFSGLPALIDYRGTHDTFGTELEVTEVAAVDEIAGAADLVMGKANGVPVAIVRGLDLQGNGRAVDLVRPPSEELFR